MMARGGKYAFHTTTPDCEVCAHCLDKPRNGGAGTTKQACVEKDDKRAVALLYLASGAPPPGGGQWITHGGAAAAPIAPAPRARDQDGDWEATARRLLKEIQGERDRNRYANLEEFRPALTRCGFSGTPPPWRAGYCGVSTPAHFPESSRIRSLAQLVNYLEGALAKEGEPRPAAPRAPAEPDDAIRDEFSLLSSSQLRQAMQARGIGRGAYDAPLEFRRKLRAHEAAHPKRKAEAESDAEDGPSAKRARDESESEVDEDAFAVGTRVEARWRKKWYPASIYAIYERGAAYEIGMDDSKAKDVEASNPAKTA